MNNNEENEFELPMTHEEADNLTKTQALRIDQSLDELVKEINEEHEKEIEKAKEEQQKIEEQKEEIQKIPQTPQEKSYLYVLFIVAIVLGIILFVYMTIYNKMNEPETELTTDQKILQTLNNRYGETFKKINDTTYETKDERITITTNADSSSKLIIYDDYLDIKQIGVITEMIRTSLLSNGFQGATVELSPKKDCRFIGKCMSNEYFFNLYKENTDETLLSKRSEEIVLKDYLNMKNVDFFNEVELMIYIKSEGKYSEYDKEDLKDSIRRTFDELNDLGYKNKAGFEVLVKGIDKITDVLRITSYGDKTGLFDIDTAKES